MKRTPTEKASIDVSLFIEDAPDSSLGAADGDDVASTAGTELGSDIVEDVQLSRNASTSIEGGTSTAPRT